MLTMTSKSLYHSKIVWSYLLETVFRNDFALLEAKIHRFLLSCLMWYTLYLQTKKIKGDDVKGPQYLGLTDERTNKSPLVFYRTSSPLGPLPCYPSPTITYIQSRAKGIADHILPLGNWFKPSCRKNCSIDLKFGMDNPDFFLHVHTKF